MLFLGYLESEQLVTILKVLETSLEATKLFFSLIEYTTCSGICELVFSCFLPW